MVWFNSCNIIKPTGMQLLKDLIHIELVEKEMVVFTKSALRKVFFSPDEFPPDFSSTLLYRNSTKKGFWSIMSSEELGKTGFAIFYFCQSFLSATDSKVFKDIVNDVEGEVDAVRKIFD